MPQAYRLLSNDLCNNADDRYVQLLRFSPEINEQQQLLRNQQRSQKSASGWLPPLRFDKPVSAYADTRR